MTSHHHADTFKWPRQDDDSFCDVPPPASIDTPGIGSGVSQNQRETPAVPVVTMLNQKGGVGKTSCTHHLAGTLAQMGRRVLLIDNDPQSSLTQGFWGPVVARQIDPASTIAAIYAGDLPYPEHVIHPAGFAGIELIPGSRRSTSHNVPDPHLADPEIQGCLRAFLDDVRDNYDLVLIDCPPNLHLCSWAALVASDHLIVPLQPEDYGAQGIIDVTESVARVLSGPNPGLNLIGYLITMINTRKTIHRLYEEMLRERYGAAVFTSMIPEAVDFVEAIAQRKPVAQFKPKGAAAKSIRALADELEQRLADRDSRGITQGAA
jgi:chromosome partitioning protein